jgi:D-alanyl-D-alanine carboxypeptidase/D-alanyl-D-alanine-endopeptidase (penicillin-binding protein 4)
MKQIVVFLILIGHQICAQKLQENKVFSNVVLSYKAVNLSSNTTISEFHPNINVTPASTQKLITTNAALEVFGPSYEMSSFIGYDGVIQNGELIGDLIIAPNANPGFCNERFGYDLEDLKVQIDAYLKTNSIQKIVGQIAVVDSARDTETLPRKWLWEDIGNYFGANPSSTIINENKLSIYFRSDEIGSLTQVIRTEPEISIPIDNHVIAHSGNSDKAYAFSRPLDNNITVHGSIPSNRSSFKVVAALPDPTLFLLDWLQNKFPNQKGIILPETPRNLKAIFGIHTVVLSKVVEETNVHSINILAENLYQRLKNENVDFPNIFSLEDGSGLSRFNLIQVEGLIELLEKNQNNNVFLTSLSVAGEKGTLKNYFNTNILRSNLTAKSGYMQGVRSYAGYIRNSKGQLIAFAIIVNNITENDSEVKAQIRKWFEELASS